MKKSLIGIVVLAFFIIAGSSQAADLQGKWSLGVSGGMGITLGPDDVSDYLPTSFVINGDLTYMLTENVGIVPLAMHYHKLSFDEDKFAQDMGVASDVMGLIDVSFWSLGFTPGILFTNSGESKIRGFGQVGLGLYHIKGTIGADIIDAKEDESSNDFGMLFGGGIEVDISEKAAIVGQARFHWVATEDESTTLLDFTGGIKFYF